MSAMLRGQEARGEGDAARQITCWGRAVVSFSFHREPVFSGPFHRPFFIWRNVSRLCCHSASFGTLLWSVNKWQLRCRYFNNLSPELRLDRFTIEQRVEQFNMCWTPSKQMQIVACYWVSHAYLLFECARLWVFCHYVVQCLHADVDDTTELVLDHANRQTDRPHRLIKNQFQEVCVCGRMCLDVTQRETGVCTNKQNGHQNVQRCEKELSYLYVIWY